jgi:hypothetical protein
MFWDVYIATLLLLPLVGQILGNTLPVRRDPNAKVSNPF